jgi:hypothetical protein
VIILAGTNDIMENTGPMTIEQSGESIASMADLATANNIRVVLCSVLPSSEFAWSPELKPAPRIVELNAWIKQYAAEKGYVYVDYYSAMKDEQRRPSGGAERRRRSPAAGRIRNHGAAGGGGNREGAQARKLVGFHCAVRSGVRRVQLLNRRHRRANVKDYKTGFSGAIPYGPVKRPLRRSNTAIA